MDKVKVSTKEIGAKFKSKNELYRFLASECGAYLPHVDLVTIWHLRDLMWGKKKIIKESAIKHINLP